MTEQEKMLLRIAADRMEELQTDNNKLMGTEALYDFGTNNIIRDLRKLAEQ